MLFDCCLLVPMLIVLASLRLIQRHRPIYAENSANTNNSTGTVQFQYWALTGAHTGSGTAAMEFISSTGTCQVPVPVLALPRLSSFLVRALGKCLYQYWHGYSLPKLVNSIVLCTISARDYLWHDFCQRLKLADTKVGRHEHFSFLPLYTQ